MSIDRTKQRLAVENSKKSVNKDTLLKINVENKSRLLPTNEINKIVDVAERFNTERQRCTYYRIIGTINPLVSNPLFNLTDQFNLDKYTLAGFNSYDFLDYSYPHDNDVNDDGDLTFAKSIKKYLKEKDGWFGHYDPDVAKAALCVFYDMEPKRERFSFLPDTNPYHPTVNQGMVKNWELTITYPKTMDKNHKMVKGGLLITEVLPVEVSTRNMTAIGVSCLHNLSIGDTVRITGTNGYNGDHTVTTLGLDNGDFENYYFVIDVPTTGTITSTSRIKRLVNGVESEYYFRRFRKIKTKLSPVIETDDYETYKAGFSENFFNDSLVQFVFNEEIDVSDLTDNLGRPLSELYFTTIKTDSNSLFSNISSGIETPFMEKLNTSGTNAFLRDIPAINKIHNGGASPFQTHIPLENNITINNNNLINGNNDFYGDLVEYNNSEIRETILAVVSHRFNTVSRETNSPLSYVLAKPANYSLTQPTLETINLGPRQEGYMYQPHHLIKIREFSNYIEEGDKYTEGLPDYAINLGDERYLWRDLLDIGFNEGDEKALDYPFLNGSHYMYQNYCFSVRRQDSFGYWGLYYGDFPSDQNGDRITDKFVIKTSDQDVC
jgi:hypothetical protein